MGQTVRSGKFTALYSNKEALQSLVSQCTTVRQILEKMRATIGSSSYRTLRAACARHGIELPNGQRNYASQAGENKRAVVDSLIWEKLVVGDKWHNGALKKRILRLGLLEDRCECGIVNVWNGKPIILELDHINGNHRDWRLENLRMLCPNCHSQTIPSRIGSRVQKKARTKCKIGHRHLRRFDPTAEYLESIIWTRPSQELARTFGVSDSALAKRCKLLGVRKPPRGYWAKLRALGR